MLSIFLLVLSIDKICIIEVGGKTMKEKEITSLEFNPFTLLGKEWCLIGAKKKDGTFNAMTASWGGVGVLWNKNVVTIYVRPQRYTKEFIEESKSFTVAFFDESYKPALSVYGSKSGRDINKEEATGLTCVEDNGYMYHEQAKLVFACDVLYEGKITYEEMVDKGVDVNYPNKDYHIVYIAEIKKVVEAQ